MAIVFTSLPQFRTFNLPAFAMNRSRGLVFPGEARWLAEHLRDGSDAGASATEEAGRINELQQLVGMLADVALGPVAKGLGHARTEQGMPRLRKQVIDGILS